MNKSKQVVAEVVGDELVVRVKLENLGSSTSGKSVMAVRVRGDNMPEFLWEGQVYKLKMYAYNATDLVEPEFFDCTECEDSGSDRENNPCGFCQRGEEVEAAELETPDTSPAGEPCGEMLDPGEQDPRD